MARGGALATLALVICRAGVVAAAPQTNVVPIKHPTLLAARNPPQATPAVKLAEVTAATTSEMMIILLFLKGTALLIDRAVEPWLRSLLTTVAWIVVVQGSSRLQGVMQKPTVVLSPDWYAKLTKPAWQPPPWAFPAAWIPLKLAQTIGAAVLWTSIGHRVFDAPAVWLYVAHITLGDVWNAQFFLKQRILTGLLIISAFWLLAVGATVAFWRESALAGALLTPTVAWVAVAASLNLDTWFLNRD